MELRLRGPAVSGIRADPTGGSWAADEDIRFMEQTIQRSQPRARLGGFERYLTLWVALCIIAGIALGSLAPAPFHALGALSLANVNLPVAVLIWLMIVPMLLRV